MAITNSNCSLELLGAHLALFGAAAVVRAAAAGAAATLQAGVVAAVFRRATIGAFVARFLGGDVTTIQPRPAVDNGLPTVRTVPATPRIEERDTVFGLRRIRLALHGSHLLPKDRSTGRAT
jgi:hypothetical protein